MANLPFKILTVMFTVCSIILTTILITAIVGLVTESPIFYFQQNLGTLFALAVSSLCLILFSGMLIMIWVSDYKLQRFLKNNKQLQSES